MSSEHNVLVVGQGYVGLPLAVAAARAGYSVVGVDADPVRVEVLSQGRSSVGDVGNEELRAVIDAGSYRAAGDFATVANADVVVLCVPTPYHNDAPDLSHVENAAAEVGKHLAVGALVILESTTYPGTTEELLLPVLEAASGLRAGSDFDLAFSPERIDPGNAQYGLHNTPKIVGGINPRSTERAASFYGRFVEKVIPVSGPKTAEMAKLLENTFRHINIALANELAILSQDLGVDFWEVVEAASSKPFGFMPFYPGPGVGGHCIPVDPMYLSWRVRQFGGAAKFIELARDVNAAMPLYCVQRIQDLLNERELPVKGSRILVVGVAYKPDISDMRESPAIALLEQLYAKGARIEYHDEYVPVLQLPGLGELRSRVLDVEALADADCVVIVTPHRAIDFEAVVAGSSLVFDTRNVGIRAPHLYLL